MPLAAPLPRQPGALARRPAVLPDARSATSTAACAASAATRSSRWTCRPTGMEFASEMVVTAHAERAARSPRCRPRCARTAAAGRPHLRTWRDGWRHLRFLLALQPALAVPLPGAGPAARRRASGSRWLSVGTARSAACPFGIHTMLACATLVDRSGLQIGGLALVARAYASRLGLLPPSVRLEKWIDRITLERGLVLGLVSALLGIAAFVVAFATWGARGLRCLDPCSHAAADPGHGADRRRGPDGQHRLRRQSDGGGSGSFRRRRTSRPPPRRRRRSALTVAGRPPRARYGREPGGDADHGETQEHRVPRAAGSGRRRRSPRSGSAPAAPPARGPRPPRPSARAGSEPHAGSPADRPVERQRESGDPGQHQNRHQHPVDGRQGAA